MKKGVEGRGRGRGKGRGRGRDRRYGRGRGRGKGKGRGREKETDSLHILWEECGASKAVSKVSFPAFGVTLIEAQIDPAHHSTHEYHYWGRPIHHTENSKDYG